MDAAVHSFDERYQNFGRGLLRKFVALMVYVRERTERVQDSGSMCVFAERSCNRKSVAASRFGSAAIPFQPS